MFEFGDEVVDVPQSHYTMAVQGPFLTHMQHCLQRIEVNGGEQRRLCIKEMHAISSTPIRSKNRRGDPLQNQQYATRPSIYSIPLSPNVSPVGKSSVCSRNYSPSEKEIPNHMDAIVPSTSAYERESQIRNDMVHNLARHTVGNDFKRNVSRRLPMATAIQRSEQYVPLEIVSDGDDSESKAFTRSTRSCRRPVNTKRKAFVHFKTNSNRGLSAQYDSIDSGRGGSAAISSGLRPNSSEDNNCSIPDDPQSDSDSGLSHCTEGPSRSHCHENERLEHLSPVGKEVETRKQVSGASKVSLKALKSRRVSRLLHHVNNQQYDYEPLEIVSDDEDLCNTANKMNNNQIKEHGKRVKAVASNEAGKINRKKLVEPVPDDVIRNKRRLSVIANSRSFSHKISRHNERRGELFSKTEAVIDSLLKGEVDQCEKENRYLEKNQKNARRHNREKTLYYRTDCNQDGESESYLCKSKDVQSCNESFAQEEMHEGNCRSKGNVSGSETSRCNVSAMDVTEDEEVEECDQDLSGNDLHGKNWDIVANYRSGEFDGSVEQHNNLNASGFTNKNSRIHRMRMSGFVDDNSRARYGESFDSDFQCGNMEHNEDLNGSGNMSGFQVKKIFGHQRQQRGHQMRTTKGIKKGYVGRHENSENETVDNESQDEINDDVSGHNDYEHRRKVHALIQSRNDSYCQQDNFDVQSVMHGEAERYLTGPQTSDLGKNNGKVVRAKDSLQHKGGMRRNMKKVVKSKVSSVAAIEQNVSFYRKNGRCASRNCGKSQTGRSSGEFDENSGYRQLRTNICNGKQLVGKKQPKKSVKKATSANVSTHKKAGKVRVTKDTQTRSSETTEFESSPVKTKQRRTKLTKTNEAQEQPIKGNLKFQSELSETVGSGSYPKKRKRGRPPMKTKKNTEAQNKDQAANENCEPQPKPVETSGNAGPPKKKRGRPRKKEEISHVQGKAQELSECQQSKNELPVTGDVQSTLKKRKSIRSPRKNNKKKKLDPAAETLQKSSDGLQESSSNDEPDKSGFPKRRPLFSNERFTNELSLNQNQVSPEENEKKTDAEPKLSPLRGKKKPTSESSSDYLRKKVLTMRLGTSAFLNSVIEENELVVTSTPKKSNMESRISCTSKVESNSKEVIKDNGVSSQPEGQLASSGKLEVDLEKHDKINKSQGILEINDPTLALHNSHGTHNKNIKSIDEPVPDSINQEPNAKPGMTSTTATAELGKKILASLPIQSLKVNDRLQSLPCISTSTIGLAASSSANRGSVQVVVEGSQRKLELFADYSKIPFRSRQKETKDNGLSYGAALDVLGLGTGFIHLTPGTEKGLQHPKSYNMVFLLLDGQVMVKIHESDLVAKPGDFFAVPKGCKYNLTGIGDRNAIVAYFKSK